MFFFSSRRRHTRLQGDWSSDVCSSDLGVTIAAGTDAGNIGTIHGPALFREFQLMKEAGLTPMQILQCATSNAAQLFGGETGAHLGKIQKGNYADLVILKSNPADDIAHASDI